MYLIFFLLILLYWGQNLVTMCACKYDCKNTSYKVLLGAKFFFNAIRKLINFHSVIIYTH